MEIVKDYSLLPTEIITALQEANMYYSKNYYNYSCAVNFGQWYLYDENLIITVSIYSKALIKYAMYPSEYFLLSDGVSLEDKKIFLDECENVLKKEGVAWVNTSAAALFDVYSTHSLRIPFGSHIIDLTLSDEELWQNVHSKHRNSIRRAEKSGVIVKRGGVELLEDYLLLDDATWARSNRNSYGRTFFQKMFDNLEDNVVIYIAYFDEVPQAGSCYFLNHKMCYYMYGASADSPETGSTNFLHWEVVKDLKKNGVERYSFVGCRIGEDENSKYHTIQRFKERFGGKLFEGYMFKTIIIPWEAKLFAFLYRIKNGNTTKDAIDQEIGKWKELNEDCSDSSMLQ